MDATTTSDVAAIIAADDSATVRHRPVPTEEPADDPGENDDGSSVRVVVPSATNWTRRCTTSRCWLLAFLCVAAVGQSMSVNGLIGVTISTIERRFALSSSQTAWITSAYEVAGIPALLVVGYIGARIRRPVWIAGGLVILSIGIFVYTLPHFASSLYQYDSNGTGLVCAVGAGYHEQCENQDSASEETGKEKFMLMFIVSSLLMGIGSVPLFVLGVTYIDDFDANSKSAFDLG
jgi:solute carrier organic anion transporter family, member 4A